MGIATSPRDTTRDHVAGERRQTTFDALKRGDLESALADFGPGFRVRPERSASGRPLVVSRSRGVQAVFWAGSGTSSTILGWRPTSSSMPAMPLATMARWCQLVVSMTNRGRAKHATPSPRLGPVVLVSGASQMRTGRNTRRWFASRLGLFGAETLD